MSEWDDEDDLDDIDLAALDALEARALEERQTEAAASAAPQPAPAAAPRPDEGGALAAPRGGQPEGGTGGGAGASRAPPGRQPGPPRTAAELAARCRHFQRIPAPPPKPSQERCPGVFGRGCGGALQLVRFADGGGCFWACSRSDCQYREFPPPRKAMPELCILLDRKHERVEVGPVPGAEEAVRYCGGVAPVLRVAGVDLRRALVPPAPPAAAAGPAAGLAPGAAAQQHGAAAATAAATAAGPAAGTEPQAGSHPVPGCGPEPAAEPGAGVEVAAAAAQPAAGAEPGLPGKPAASNDVVMDSTGADQQQEQQRQQEQEQDQQQPQAPLAAAADPALQPVVFPLMDYERLSSQLLQFGRQHNVFLLSSAGMVPPATLKAARGGLRPLPSPAQVQQLYARMPAFLEAALLPFQREGVLFGLAHGGRCLIADEMGVGKTVQAIALSSCFQDEWPLLVIVPASLRLVWAEEIEKWLPYLRPSCIHVIEGKEDRVAQGCLPHVTITSYEMMQRLTCDACKGRAAAVHNMCHGARPACQDLRNCIASQGWKVVVVDESHTLRTSHKPPDALHTEAVVTAVKAARRAILLTGTPSLSRPFDLYRQVDAVLPGLLGNNRLQFAGAYCNKREVPLPAYQCTGDRQRTHRMDVSGLARGAELHDMLKAEVMLRRLKRDVLSQLPPKRRQVIRLPKPPASEWPKLPAGSKRHADDSEGSLSSAGEEEEEKGCVGQEGDGSSGRAQKPMSAAHRTGLAKASSVIDWLMTALGVRAGGKSRGRAGAGGAAQGDDDGGDDGSSSSGGVPSADAPKFLVFAHHKGVMNRLAAALEGATGYAPVGYVRIDGSTDSEDRRTAARRFHCDASVRVALLSVMAAGVGLDFSAASVVVFAELPDEVAHVRQAEDRAHRQGQRQPVNVYFLCAKGTADDRRWQRLNRSLARVSAVHDGACLPAPAAHGEQDDGAAEAVAAQAGLLVECVHDAELAGLTPAAAKAGGMAEAYSAAATGGTRSSAGKQPTAAATTPGAAIAAAAVAAALAAAAPEEAAAAVVAAEQAAAAAPAPAARAAAGVADCGAAAAAAAAPAAEQGGQGGQQGQHIQPPAGTAPGGLQSPPGSAGRRQPTRGHRAPSAALRAASAASPERLCGPGSNQAPAPAQADALDLLLAQGVNAAQLPAAEPEVQVWFEVSGNTGRIHFHANPDGSAPLRLSLPMDALLAGDSPPLEELLQAVGSADCEQQQQGPAAVAATAAGAAGQPAAAAAAVPEVGGAGAGEEAHQAAAQQPRRPVVVNGVGVLALDPQVSAARLAAMLAEAREFAAEWRELRGLHQARLQGKVLRAPLQEAVEEVEQAAAAAGHLGTSNSRFVDAKQRDDLALPPGAEWRTVRVLFKRYAKEAQYAQPFLPSGARLCINCAKPVPGPAAAQPAEAVLDGMTNLFCGGECEGRFALKSNGSAYRRALFKLERGVCVTCRLDCHTLVKRLQAVEKGSRDWEEQRRRIIAARAPRLMQRGYKAYLDLLVRRAVEGNAWQADHILPVYKGGGLCDVDNLRTLCVACHADVTKEQVKERASRRQQEKAAKGGNGGGGRGGGSAGMGWQDVEQQQQQECQGGGDADGGGGGNEDGKPVVQRRARMLKRVLIEDTDEESEASLLPDATDGAAAATGPAAVRRGGRGSAPAAAGGGRQPVAKRRPRLKRLLTESDDLELALGDAPLGGQPAAAGTAAAGTAAEGQAAGAPPVQPRAKVGRRAPAAAASKPALKRRVPKLKRLLSESEDSEMESSSAALGGEAQAPAACAAGAAAAAGQRHRLARSSTADEPAAANPAQAGEAVPLTAGAANSRHGGKRGRPAGAAGEGGGGAVPAANKPSRPAWRIRAAGRAYVD